MSAFTRSALLVHCKAADARALGAVTTLDLSKQNIAQLDIDFAELPLLRVLNLSGNQLCSLPASIKCLVRALACGSFGLQIHRAVIHHVSLLATCFLRTDQAHIPQFVAKQIQAAECRAHPTHSAAVAPAQQ